MQKINEELCRATNNKLLVNAHSFMHAASNLVAVFWYQIDSGKLVYSLDKDANHYDSTRLDRTKPWINGRIVKINEYYLMAFYSRNDINVTKSVATQLLQKLESRLNIKIMYAIDYDGFEIEIN